MARGDPTLASTTAALIQVYGLLLTPKNVQNLLRCGRATAYEWLAEVPAVCVGKRKLYRAEDVARKVLDSMEQKGAVV